MGIGRIEITANKCGNTTSYFDSTVGDPDTLWALLEVLKKIEVKILRKLHEGKLENE